MDGFPRNAENVQHWNKLVADAVNVAFVLYLDCPEEIMSKRLLSRAATSGRADDNAATIAKRFAVFNAETVPVVKQYATTVCCCRCDVMLPCHHVSSSLLRCAV